MHFLLPSIILVELLRNRTLLNRVQKVMVCDLWSVGLDPSCVFIMIDGSEKHNCEGGFWTLEFACLWNAQ